MEETTTTTPETNTAENTQQEAEPAKHAESTPAEKTFTQKELDDIVTMRIGYLCVKPEAFAALVPAAAEIPDCTLSALTIGSLTLTPTFDAAVTSYTATTENNTNTVTATAKDEDATVSIKVNDTAITSGSAATWITGANTVEVKVTNGDYSKTYTVTVTKE